MTSAAAANRTAAVSTASTPAAAAPQTAKTEPSPPPIEEEWTESQLIAALAHLEQLQDQLDALRLTIPTIIHSLTTPHPSPEAMYKAVKEAAWNGSQGLDVFKRMWEGERTREVMARVKGSLARDAEFGVLVEGEEGVPVWGWSEGSGGGKERGKG